MYRQNWKLIKTSGVEWWLYTTTTNDYIGPVGYGREGKETKKKTGRRVQGNAAKKRVSGKKKEVSWCAGSLGLFSGKFRVRRAETLLQIKRRQEVHKSIDIWHQMVYIYIYTRLLRLLVRCLLFGLPFLLLLPRRREKEDEAPRRSWFYSIAIHLSNSFFFSVIV